MKIYKHIKNFLVAIGSAVVGCTERGKILPYPLHDLPYPLHDEHKVMSTILKHAPELSQRQALAIAADLWPLSDDIKNLTDEELLKELNQ